MSKRKKRKTPDVPPDAPVRPPAPSSDAAPQPVSGSPGRYRLALLIVVGSLWTGWFLFLVYVALTRS